MQIYVIDDKQEEITKACNAIKANGHEIAEMMTTLSARLGIRDFNKSDRLSKPSSSTFAIKEFFSSIEKMKTVGGGIITDMMFHLATATPNDPVPPSGVLVVLHAIANGVPVVVCTDTSEVGGHHAKALHWIYDGYILPAQLKGIEIPFGWVENKDWDAAVKLLEQLHAERNEGD